MDNVLLMQQHLTEVTTITDKNGEWIDGQWVEQEGKQIVFMASIFPLNPNDFKNYPEGILRHDDRKLITKQILNDNDEIMIYGKKFIIVKSQKYEYLADINWYIIRESKVI